MADLQEVYNQLRRLLEEHASGLTEYDEYLGSQAKDKKLAYHLYGKEPVSIMGRQPQQTYFAGTILQKNYASLYFMPMYSHPERFQDLSPELKKMVKGKSCINIKNLDAELTGEIDRTIVRGKELFREIGWI